MPVPHDKGLRPRRAGRIGATGSLIVGYGNPLRSDDGLGLQAARRLAADPRLAGAQVVWQYQLMPELAVDVSRATLVVLIDVTVEHEAGALSIRRLDVAAETGGSAWSHHLEPAQLVGLARELWGAAPDVFIVSVGAASLEVGEVLSEAVDRALPGLVEAVVEIVEKHGRRRYG